MTRPVTAEELTDDEIESFVRRRMAEEPERRIYWLGMGDEALAHPDVGAPYREYCRRTIIKAMREEHIAAAINARGGK